MITADTSEIFPACPTFGFTMEPQYLVKVVSREGGFERRQRVWSRPLHCYTGVPLAQRPQADIEEVLYFWHAHGGMSEGFRFKDQADYQSCRLDDSPTFTDQPLVVNPDSPGGYQLVKQYTFGARTQEREITRPKGNSIRVANELGVEQASSKWTLDESTGLLTPGGTFSGTPTSWGGEFYVWVRFDGQFAPELSNHKVQTATVQLKEIRGNA